MGNTIGVEYLNGETTTPLSISTASHTFVAPVANTLLLVVVPTLSGGAAMTGVAELATTIGRLFGTPGELTDPRQS